MEESTTIKKENQSATAVSYEDITTKGSMMIKRELETDNSPASVCDSLFRLI